MDLTVSLHDLQRAENFLAQGDLETALSMLLSMRDAAEEYIEASCQTTDDTQYFSFADAFERLCYRRVERDPRSLVQVEFPFDHLYSDLAFAYIRQQEYTMARDALMQAVRWNPMNCNYRLDLAELFRVLGNKQEWAALSVSVLERASDPVSAGRAYANLGQFFLDEDNTDAAVACVRLASTLAAGDQRTTRLVDRLAEEDPAWEELAEDRATGALSDQGVPTSPNAEVAICLLMCASDAAKAGDRDEATRLTVRARDLIGDQAAKALIQLIHESDAELAAERAAASETTADAGDVAPADDSASAAPSEEASHA